MHLSSSDKMIGSANFIISNNARKVLFGILLVFFVGVFTFFQWKEIQLSNNLHREKILINFSEKDTDYFNSLTGIQLMEYLKWFNQKACKRVVYYGGPLNKSNKYTFRDGQKAICLDKGLEPQENSCLAYSIGINNEWTFDEAMETYGCQVYCFDPTMNKKKHNRTPKIHFYPIGLGARDEVLKLGEGRQINSMNIKDNITSFNIMKLSSIYRMLSPIHGENSIIDYLKIDIEFAEWDVIPELIESGILDRVRQMGIEIHLTNGENLTLLEFQKEAKILHKLEKEGGMVRFDSKENLISNITFKNFGNMKGYFAHEMAWYNKKYRQ